MPFWVSTNTPGTGMDAPTWRAAYDRFLILPQGRLNIIEFDFYRRIAEVGIPERSLWQFSWQGQARFDPVWEMVLEGSTGFSGAFARQVTLSKSTANQELTADLMKALETAASEEAIVLEAEGIITEGSVTRPIALQYVDGIYENKGEEAGQFTHADLMELALSGEFLGTFTARHGGKADTVAHPQPALWTLGPIEKQSGHQKFPVISPSEPTMLVSGRHVELDAHVIVDGRRTEGSLAIIDNEQIEIQLATLPNPGIHLLQVQNPGGQFSNDFIFHVVESAEAVDELIAMRAREDRDIRDAIADAIAANDIDELRSHLSRQQQQGRVRERQPRSGTIPLSNAALHGRMEIAEVLLRHGADVNATNNDGNTPLHVAAFFCRDDLVKWLLLKGASTSKENDRGETPLDVVSGTWDDGLAGLYQTIGGAVGVDLDLGKIRDERPKIAALLKEQSTQEKSSD